MHVTEADEVAANMSLDGLRTYTDCRRRVQELMGDQGPQIIDNVADSLHDRLRRKAERDER